MPLILTPDAPRDLPRRLAGLRTRLRAVLAVRESARLAALVIGGPLLAGWLDRWLNLPPALRAVLLVAWLTAIGIVAARKLVGPWRALGDDLALALAVERTSPAFAEALASAIAFRQPGGDLGSTDLRRATVELAEARAIEHDPADALTPAGGPSAVLALALVCAVAGVSLLAAPADARAALARFLDPYGRHPWPPRTRLTVVAPAAMVRGDPFLVTVNLAGVVPERLRLQYALDGSDAVELTYPLSADEPEPRLQLRLEPARVPRSFRFRVTAHDAASDWLSVVVRVPPQLVPIDGRPSPRGRLVYPSYTDQPAADLPDGTGGFEAIVGTRWHLRAAFDRPVAKAWVEFSPDRPAEQAAVAVAGIGLTPLGSAAVLALTQPVWGDTALSLSPDRLTAAGSLVPPLTGTYHLKFADADGLTGRRPMEARILPDPSPGVMMDRPAAGRDSKTLPPEAEFTLRHRADDPICAVRSVAIEYRVNGGPPRRIPLYDGSALGRAMTKLLTDWPAPETRLRPTVVEAESRRPLSDFSRVDGSPLADGDVLGLAVVADDFDDVTWNKPPGRSHEVEIRIVSTARFEAQIQKGRTELAKQLRDLARRQADARALAEQAERHQRATGELRPEDADALRQVEQWQRQVRNRLAEDPDGVQPALDQLRQAARDGDPIGRNAVPFDRAAAALDRAVRDDLEPAESALAESRAAGSEPIPPDQRPGSPLARAVERQKSAERALTRLAEELEAGNAARAARAEIHSLAADQQRLGRQLDELRGRAEPGADPADLPGGVRDELERLKDRQESLAAQAAQLERQLAAKADELRQQPDPEAAAQAEALERAAAAGRAGDESTARAMSRAADEIGRNRLGEAAAAQDAAERGLAAAADALDDPPGDDLDRLAKRQQEAAQALDDVLTRQEQLQMRAERAAGLDDPQQRREEQDRLARDQRELAEQTRELAERLDRAAAEAAARDARQAAGQMDAAAERLERGGDPLPRQDDALERLDEAERELDQDRRDTQQQLEREKARQLADIVTGLKARQLSLAAETDRIAAAVRQNSGWSRALRKSFADLGRDQDALADEVERAGDRQQPAAPVFARALGHAADAMRDAAAVIDERKTEVELDGLDDDREAVLRPQRLAVRRLEQLLEAVAAEPLKPNAADGPPPPGQPPPENAGDDAPKVVMPPRPQLKLLRALQVELNERTADFAVRHPDPQLLPDEAKAELDELRRLQAELAELFAAIMPESP